MRVCERECVEFEEADEKVTHNTQTHTHKVQGVCNTYSTLCTLLLKLLHLLLALLALLRLPPPLLCALAALGLNLSFCSHACALLQSRKLCAGNHKRHRLRLLAWHATQPRKNRLRKRTRKKQKGKNQVMGRRRRRKRRRRRVGKVQKKTGVQPQARNKVWRQARVLAQTGGCECRPW